MDVLWVLLAFTVVYALVATPVGVLSDRVGRIWVVFLGWGAHFVTYLGFAAVGLVSLPASVPGGLPWEHIGP